MLGISGKISKFSADKQKLKRNQIGISILKITVSDIKY